VKFVVVGMVVVEKDKIVVELENFKIDILSTLGSQINTLKAKKKQEEQNEALTICFH